MIHESSPWKERLTKDADLVERWSAKPAITDRRSFLIEQKIFLAAYAMRKLVEAQKLSTSFGDRSMRCEVFQKLAERVTLFNNHKIDELYDFDTQATRAIGARDILDIIIHSLVFAEVVEEDGTASGFFVTSDRRQQTLWLVDMCEFISLMRVAANDYPSHAVRVFDQEADDWFCWQGHGEPPAHVQDKIDRLLSRK